MSRTLGPWPVMFALACGGAQGWAQSSGEISLGWREVDVNGDRAKYRQHLNLDDGPRLLEAAFTWRAASAAGQGPGPDRLSLRLSDLGGDPYESARLEMGLTGRYRFTYEHQESEYVYDDVLVLPENASAESSTGGDFRRFDFERVRDRADLEVDLTERTSFTVGFERYRREGDGTVVLDVEREEFELDQSIEDTMQVAEASVSHSWERGTVTLTERYRTFDYGPSAFLPGASEGSDPQAPGALEAFFLDQPYDLEGVEHQLQVRARPTDRLRVSAYALAGDVDVDLDARERSRGTSFAGAPFDRALEGGGRVEQDRRLYQVGLDYALTPRVNVFARLRSAALDQDAGLQLETTTDTHWDIDTLRTEAGAEVALGRAWHVASGWTVERRDVEAAPATSVDSAGSLVTEARGGFVRISWRPSTRGDVQLTVEDDSLDDPFTLASPTDARRYRLRARWRISEALGVNAGYRQAERRNDSSGWYADSEQWDARLTWHRDPLSVSAGISRVELSRSIDALVLAGLRQVLFDIDYAGRADMADGAVTWRIAPSWLVGASARWYDNEGSFPVSRDDVRAFLEHTLQGGYRWGVEYRTVDFREGGIEEFDADLVEVSFGLSW